MARNARPNKDVVLLDDLPAKVDAFGAHARIAQSIRELIATEPGGKAIALVGSWGGGKSTVINLLRAGEESKADGLAVFVFDAWVHEGDPLRRTFLEKFTVQNHNPAPRDIRNGFSEGNAFCPRERV
jgi:predicted KAP-like P-loop ATPase